MTFAQRAADRMKSALSTWTALIGVIVFIVAWMATNGAGQDPPPWIGLNLCLSCFAALQCFVLLISGRRAEQIAAELAQHAYETGEQDFAKDSETNALLKQLLVEMSKKTG